ncbi:hypothetical protein KJZ63_02145 [Patescibacteria group bacterium]|nr:hypothetical protein [Patescibacteria group bacterium]
MLNEAAHHNPETQILAKSLESLGKQHGYKIKVLDLGTNVPHFEDPKINQIAEALSDFLTAPTIKDEFGREHHKRRNFYAIVETTDPKLFIWYQKNRLRYNNLLALGYVQLAFQNTLDLYPEANQIFSEIMRVFPKSAEEFNAMTDNEKVRTTNTIARALKAALDKFKN